MAAQGQRTEPLREAREESHLHGKSLQLLRTAYDNIQSVAIQDANNPRINEDARISSAKRSIEQVLSAVEATGVDVTPELVTDEHIERITDRLIGIEPPYGGPDWTQTEGWEVRECIKSTTAQSIRAAIDS